MPRAVLLLSSVAVMLATAGCITHSARIEHPADQAGQGVIGASARPSLPPITTVQRPLPIDVVVSSWHRDADGRLYRFDGRVRTPLPWWQRFPVDIATDAWPRTLVAEAALAVAYRPVPVTARDRLFAAATADGWLGKAPAPTVDAAR